ncbi:MAG: peptidyl-prolyl cis-trans isomerase [Candidatus Omnitrophota bacterium]
MNDFINFTRVQLSADYSGKELETKIQEMRLNLLDRLIEDKLILQEAKAEKLEIDKSRIQSRKNEIRKKYPSEADFQKTLSQQGLTEADLEKKMTEQLLMYYIIEFKVRSKIKVTPTEVTAFYEGNKSQFKSPEEKEFESVVAPDQITANAVASSLKSGTSVTDAAKKYELTVNRLTFTKGGEFRQDVEEVLSALEAKEVSQPIKIDNSYYVFKLFLTVPASQQTLAQAQDTIYKYLFEMKMQESLGKWIDDIKKKSYIKHLQS